MQKGHTGQTHGAHAPILTATVNVSPLTILYCTVQL